jgi:two-component system cell cycle response regulator CtrA
MRVLLIEPDALAAQAITGMLERAGFAVIPAGNADEGLSLAKHADHDAIVLEPHANRPADRDVIATLRLAKVASPILVLSMLSGVVDKVRALGAGADDYLVKPCHADELAARLLALVRRSLGHADAMVAIDGGLRIDLAAKRAYVDDVGVSLTGKEYAVLELLALRRGRVLPKDAFIDHIYGGLDEPEVKIVDVFI